MSKFIKVTEVKLNAGHFSRTETILLNSNVIYYVEGRNMEDDYNLSILEEIKKDCKKCALTNIYLNEKYKYITVLETVDEIYDLINK